MLTHLPLSGALEVTACIFQFQQLVQRALNFSWKSAGKDKLSKLFSCEDLSEKTELF